MGYGGFFVPQGFDQGGLHLVLFYDIHFRPSALYFLKALLKAIYTSFVGESARKKRDFLLKA